MKRELKCLMKDYMEVPEGNKSTRSSRYEIHKTITDKPIIRIGKRHQADIPTRCDQNEQQTIEERDDQLILNPVQSHEIEYVNTDVMLFCLEN